MTQEQTAAIKALRRCSFVPASADKRFVRHLSDRLEGRPEAPLTDAQAARLAQVLHRYRRQHRSCPCGACQAEAAKAPHPFEGLVKAGCGNCPCGGAGTLFRRKGESGPPRCAVCVGLMSDKPVEITVWEVKPVPPKPYPWLGEEQTDDGIMRRFCLSCGEAMEVAPERRGAATKYPGFTRWYREHIPCGKDWQDADGGGADG